MPDWNKALRTDFLEGRRDAPEDVPHRMSSQGPAQSRCRPFRDNLASTEKRGCPAANNPLSQER